MEGDWVGVAGEGSLMADWQAKEGEKVVAE